VALVRDLREQRCWVPGGQTAGAQREQHVPQRSSDTVVPDGHMDAANPAFRAGYVPVQLHQVSGPTALSKASPRYAASRPRWTRLGGSAGRGDEVPAYIGPQSPVERRNKLLVPQGKLGGCGARVYPIATTSAVPAGQREPCRFR
jgi:hypothetical protein